MWIELSTSYRRKANKKGSKRIRTLESEATMIITQRLAKTQDRIKNTPQTSYQNNQGSCKEDPTTKLSRINKTKMTSTILRNS